MINDTNTTMDWITDLSKSCDFTVAFTVLFAVFFVGGIFLGSFMINVFNHYISFVLGTLIILFQFVGYGYALDHPELFSHEKEFFLFQIVGILIMNLSVSIILLIFQNLKIDMNPRDPYWVFWPDPENERLIGRQNYEEIY